MALVPQLSILKDLSQLSILKELRWVYSQAALKEL
jgi:hypothetical protein